MTCISKGRWELSHLLLHHSLLLSFPQPLFLFSCHQIMVERMQWHQKTRRAMLCTAHCAGRRYFPFFFFEAMPLSQHNTYHTSSHFLKWMQILIFSIYLLYLSFMRRNYHTWTGKKIKEVIWPTGRGRRALYCFHHCWHGRCTGPLAHPLLISPEAGLPIDSCWFLYYIKLHRTEVFCARCTNKHCKKAPVSVLWSGVYTWTDKEKRLR